MKTHANQIALSSALLFIALAYGVDWAIAGLRQYGGTTFDFRTAIAGQLGLALVFGFLVVAFQTVLVHLKPTRTVFGLVAGLGALLLLTYTGYFYGGIPGLPSLSSTATPWPFTAIAITIVFWSGLSHRFRRDLDK